MVDVFLIITIIIVFVILFVSGTYILVYYQHPDDRNTAWFAKVTVLFGYVIACTTVLLLPLDVANNGEYAGCQGFDTKACGGLNMNVFWEVFFWLIPLWIFVLIPFNTFYYEADADKVPPPAGAAPPDELEGAADKAGEKADDTDSPDKDKPEKPKKTRSRFKQALCNLVVVNVVVALLLFTAYWTLSDAKIPVRHYSGGSLYGGARPAGVIFQTLPRKDDEGTVQHFSADQLAKIQPNDAILLKLSDSALNHVTYKSEISTFYAGLMTFLGWILFSLFGGIGLAAMPIDLMYSWINRPKQMSEDEIDDMQHILEERVRQMVEIGEQIGRERHDKAQMSENMGVMKTMFPTLFQKRSGTMREFKAAVFLLQKDVDDFSAFSSSSEKFNPLYPYIALFFGSISSLLSFFWVMHTMLYTLPDQPVLPFLNSFFSFFDFFPLVGIAMVSIFTLYLLFCAIKGCFKFGMRFVCLSFYPMKVGKTFMSSFMFNIGLVLACALPVVQFSVMSFDEYATHSTIRQIFEVQIEYLGFFVYFFENNVFEYILLLLALLTTIYLINKKRKNTNDGVELQKKLMKSKSRGTNSGASNATGGTGDTFEDEHDALLS